MSQLPFTVSWEELHRHTRVLAARLHSDNNGGRGWKGLIAVTRGGLVPAAIIARELDIRLIDTICVRSYSNNHKQENSVEWIKEFTQGDEDGWLMIDDLVDTGKTAVAIKKALPKAHFATVYAKPQGRPLVDSFVTEVSQDTWIYFPWDLELSSATPVASR